MARLPDAIVPVAVLGGWLLAHACARRSDARAALDRARILRIGAASVVLLLTTWAVIVMADVRNGLNTSGIINRRGAFNRRVAELGERLKSPMPHRSNLPSRISEALLPFYGYVERCSKPSDRLVMTGLSPDVFVLANRGFAGGQMAFRPSFYTSPSDQQRALARLQKQSVPLVIVNLEEEGGFRQEMPRIVDYVESRYARLARIDVPGTRGLQLYVERDRRAAGTDRATGWPCFN
jgi:hypothetical protein